MKQRTFSIVIGVFFSLITLLHIGRVAFGWNVTVGNAVIPMWASWIAIVVGAYFAYQSFKLGRNAK
jgi:hypothetical protein